MMAAIVLFFCLAVTNVEARSVPFIAQLTAENTGTVNSKNNKFVGQAFAYLSSARGDFHVSILTVLNINPDKITKVQLFDVAESKLIGSAFKKSEKSGYTTYDARIKRAVGESIAVGEVAVYVYTKDVGTKRPALSGLLANNRTTFISYLQADQEVTTPTGVSKNDGFASASAYPIANQYFVDIVVNHDLDQTVTAITFNGVGPSNTVGPVIQSFDISLTNAAKTINLAINSSVYYWMINDLTYINIITSKNPAGALRGQFIPLTSSRLKTPLFPNGAVVGDITLLPDGSRLRGALGLNLIRGGAKNLTENTTDPRVVEFVPIEGTFNNPFRFPLPVTLKNKFTIRGATVILTVAGEAVDTEKYRLGMLNYESVTNTDVSGFITSGRRSFQTYTLNLEVSDLTTLLGPGGLYPTIIGSGVAGNLYVDRFYVSYAVTNAYANNVLKSIFFKGSDASA